MRDAATAAVHQADEACVREVASARAALPPRSPWTIPESATAAGIDYCNR
jgi:hypothetical protein